MPVQDYGTVIGQFDHFDRDDANNYGNYYHGHIFVRVGSPAATTPALLYNCAVDVKYPNGVVQYFVPVNLDASKFTTVSSMPDGFQSLARTATSGALDYIRNPLLSIPLGCLTVWAAVLQAFTKKNQQVWQENVGGSALNDLQGFLSADGGIQRIYVFGARYLNAAQSPPQGMHDCHMNQGDPPGQYQALDAIWQDGGVIAQRPNGHLAGFFVKFVTQSLNTNTQGLPV
jgi:hypothetical protein